MNGGSSAGACRDVFRIPSLQPVAPAGALLKSLLTLAVVLWAGGAEGFEVDFRLVPTEDASRPMSAEETWLPEGVVYLYRDGERDVAMSVPANVPTRIPPGRWRWIAEAPGYVSVTTGTITVAEDVSRRKTLFWYVVAACRVELDAAASWRGLERLDIVSLRHHSTLPVVLKAGAVGPRHVPRGPVVTYSIARGRLHGMSHDATGCREQRWVLSPPAPPRSGRMSALVHVRVPDDFPDKAIYVTSSMEAGGAPPTPPVGAIARDRDLAVFFVDVPVHDGMALTIDHPAVQTVTRTVEPEPETVVEIGVIDLVPRQRLKVSVDYRPVIEHSIERLELSFCGHDDVPRQASIESCTTVAQLPLEPGAHAYEFAGLDRGHYVLSATIDDEILHGMGEGYFPVIGPDEPASRHFVAQEHRIYGEIRWNGVAVAGRAILVPRLSGWRTRRFPTDERLRYSLTYFGRRSSGPYSVKGDERLDPGETAGLGYLYQLGFCNDRDRCDILHPESIIRGSGRLDYEFSEQAGLRVTVLDAEDGRWVPGAQVRTFAPTRRLVFLAGDVDWQTRNLGEAVQLSTGGNGTVWFGGLDEGPTAVAVERAGYEGQRKGVRLESDEDREIEIRLARTREGGRGLLRLSMGSGAPLERAVMLGFKDGRRVGRCTEMTSAAGVLPTRPSAGCEAVDDLLVVHHRCGLAFVRPSHVYSGRDVIVPSAPPDPLRVRVIDAESGNLIPSSPIRLIFNNAAVSEADLLQARSLGGHHLIWRSPAGEILVRGVTSGNSDSPVVAVAGTEAAAALHNVRRGEPVEVWLDQDP